MSGLNNDFTYGELMKKFAEQKQSPAVAEIRKLLIILLVPFLFLYCSSDDGNPVSAGALAGNYKLASFKDKANNQTFTAGQPKQVSIDGVLVTVTVSATLELTETRFTLEFTQTVVSEGIPQKFSFTDSGTYTIKGFTMTQVSDNNGGTSTMTIRIIDGKVIMETPDVQLVFVNA